jgi:hypothetical protein
MMAQFVKKENRVRLCDNMKVRFILDIKYLGSIFLPLKHHEMNHNKPEPTSQGEHACPRCHSVVYCSVECQNEDWRALHRSECAHMLKAYKG